MSFAREIPGFYFDVERGKYFRIQPNHKAPAGAAHSQSAVDAKKRADRIIETARLRRDRSIKSVQRFDHGSHTTFSLDLRLGAKPSKNMSNLQRYYAASMCRQNASVLEGGHLCSMAISDTGNLYAVVRNHNRMNNIELIQANDSTWPVRSLSNRPIISTHGSTNDQLAVFGDSHFAAVHDGKLTIGKAGSFVADEPVVVFDLGQVRDMASLPKSGSLALAGQRRDDNRLWFVKDVRQADVTSLGGINSEQMVVTFKDENIIMSGQRNGIVNFTDHRAPSTIARLKHSSAVTGIEQARSPNHVLVSGMQSTSIYDLRAITAVHVPAPTNDGHNDSRKKRRVRNSTTRASRPVISFYVPTERYSDFYGSGKALAYISYYDIAVMVSHSSRALGSQTESFITLYDAHSGCTLLSPVTKSKFERISGVKVGRVRDGPESIFVSTPKYIQEWSVDLPDREIGEKLPDGTRSLYLGVNPFPRNSQPGMVNYWASGDINPD